MRLSHFRLPSGARCDALANVGRADALSPAAGRPAGPLDASAFDPARTYEDRIVEKGIDTARRLAHTAPALENLSVAAGGTMSLVRALGQIFVVRSDHPNGRRGRLPRHAPPRPGPLP